MSDVIIYKVDSTEIDEQFRRLDFNSSEMKRAINRGLSISANIVKKQGIANLMTVEYGKPLANADFLSKGMKDFMSSSSQPPILDTMNDSSLVCSQLSLSRSLAPIKKSSISS